MDRNLARGLTLATGALVVGGIVGWIVGLAHRDPDPRRAPTATLLAAWTLAILGAPLVAALAAWLLARPAHAAAAAFWASFLGAAAVGLAAPAVAFAPEDFALFEPMDWLGTIGRGVAGAAGIAALAGAMAWGGASARLRGPIRRTADAPPSAPPAPASPAIVPPREPDPEALAIAKRRLAMGELTRHDYDELVRRLRE